jgi:hypothetical protein
MAHLSYHLKSENLEGFASEARQLILLAGTQQLSVLMWDKPGQKIISLEAFAQIEDWHKDWPMMLQRSSLLSFRHLETDVFYTSERALLIPGIFYDPQAASGQLAVVFGECYEVHSGADIFEREGMILAWEAPAQIYETLSGHFYSIRHKSVAGLLMELAKSRLDKEVCGHILVTEGHAWVAIWRGIQLLMLHSIVMKTPEDFAFHLLNICHQWGLDYDQIHWRVAGMLQTGTPFWQVPEQFFQYFEPWHFGASEADELQPHFYGYLAEFLKMGASRKISV